MQLVHHLPFEGQAAPPTVRPRVTGRIDYLRRSEGAIRLETGRRVGEQSAVEAVTVTRSAGNVRHPGGEVPVVFTFERELEIEPGLAMNHQPNVTRPGRPDPEVRGAVGLHLRPDRVSGDTTHQWIAHRVPAECCRDNAACGSS